MILKQYLDQVLENDLQYISIRKVETKTVSFAVRNENVEGVTQGLDLGLMIEVMYEGQLAYTAINSLDNASVLAGINRARALAVAAKKHGLHPFTLKERPETVLNYESPAKTCFSDFDLEPIQELLLHLSETMKIDEKIIDRVSYFSLTEIVTEMVATNGTNIRQTITRTSLGLSCTASDGLDSQHRSFGHDQNAQWGFDRFTKDKYTQEAKRIAEEALELLSAPDCPTDICDLILTPDQMYLQIHESIGHPLELDRILGDERNYAGWSFVKPGDFNHLQYGSNLMNVSFDPSVTGQNASYGADDVGVKATTEYLIKDGKLLRGIGGIESQKRLGVDGVASQRATNWNRAPIDRMGNINLEPGDSSLEDMIKNVKKGVMMFTNRSWSIDDYRNKFQFGCEYGKLIEDGKITKTVKNPNYRGITNQFWNSLKMVGNRDTFEVGGLSNCGKGEPNQVIFVGHASPVCLFSNIEVFGGGKK